MQIDFARLGRLIRKELNEILRDRRTIITLVLMPVLLYPLLSVAFRQFFLASGLTAGKDVEYRLAVLAEEDWNWLNLRLTNGEDIRSRRAQAAQAKAKAGGADGAAPAEPNEIVKAQLFESFEQAMSGLKGGGIDGILRRFERQGKPPPPNKPGQRDLAHFFEIVYAPRAPRAQGLLAYIEERLALTNEVDLLRRLNRAPEAPPISMVRLLRAPLDSEAESGAIVSLAALVPLILILMTITGAVYPAIDLTAGERERGTLEILVAAPVPRLGLLFAKYVSVVTVAVLTALVNLTAMTVTLLLSGLGPMLFPGEGLSAGTIIAVFGLLLLFAAFFSAVLLCITSFARSFKEAQAYLIPLMLVSLAPGVAGMLPGLKLSDWAVAPLVNVVLLGRDLFEGKAELGPALLVIASTLIYSAAAIGLAARIFGAENVLYNEQTNWADLFRRPTARAPYATLTTALWCLALMIPLNFVLQGMAIMLVRGGILDRQQLIRLGPLHAIVLFGVLPGLFAWHGRLRMGSAFGWKRASLSSWTGATILGGSLWPLVFAGMALLDLRLDEAQQRRYEEIAEMLRSFSTPVRIGLVVVPALLEEWFFRGFLFGALRRRGGATAAIVATAFLFGATHYVFSPEMGRGRVLPSAAMGLALGVVRELSGSVGPGMLLHSLHNALLILLLRDERPEHEQLETWWIAAGAVGSGFGALLCWWGKRESDLEHEVVS